MTGQSALLICGHGSKGAPANSMKILAQRLSAENRFDQVEVCCLYGSPGPAEALKSVEDADHVTVLPYMLAEGYASKVVLPQLFKSSGRDLPADTFLPVLGKSPLLATVAIDMALRTAEQYGWDLGEVALTLLGHGSNRHPNSGETCFTLAKDLKSRDVFGSVSTVFLDQAPYAREILSPPDDVRRIIIGMFADRSVHGDEDAMEIAHQAGSRTVYSGPIGADPLFIDVARDIVARRTITAA